MLRTRKTRVFTALGLMVILVVASVLALWQNGSSNVRQVTAADNCRNFPETGFQVCGKFLDYWNSHGGLAQQGYPISNVFNEQNAAPPAGDGKVHPVQYFERARFEDHPENQPPYDVLLGLMGQEQYLVKYKGGGGLQLLTFNGKRTETQIGGRNPRSGYVFLVVDVTVKDTRSDKLLTNPFYLRAISASGFAYQYSDTTFLLPKSLKPTQLNPNETTRGEVAFEVPNNENIQNINFEDAAGKTSAPVR